MKSFKVLGSGCKNCDKTESLIKQKAAEMNVDIEISKVTDISDIMAYGVMSTPGVVMNEIVVHAGGIPSGDTITNWLSD